VSTESIAATLELHAAKRRSRSETGSVLFEYWELTKPEINLLIAITTGASFSIAAAGVLPAVPWIPLFQSVLGTALVASGAATLNQLIELPYDARMRRTARRPLASGRLAPWRALWFGVALSVVGVAYLAISTNALAAFLAALTLIGYLFLYTPLKRITPLCTLVGAIPGAAPPLIGWAAARGHLDPAAWGLFAMVFLWQFPHFMPIAWMYREDYARAGYLVLPRRESSDRFVMWHTVAPSAALMVVSLLPAINRLSGLLYAGGAFALGVVLLCYSVRFAIHRTTIAARQLLIASILYLPAIFGLLILDKA